MNVPDLGYRPTIPTALRRAARMWGARDFVVTPDRRMTYAEAEERSRRLAKRMLLAGIGKGTRVGLYFTYGQEWVIAWLAASRIGALVMPIATTYRPTEIRTVLRIGDIDTLITASTVLGRDMHTMLEQSVPGLADATSPRLFFPATPYLRAIWVTGGTNRAWATPVDLEAEPDVAVDDELLEAIEAEIAPADLAQVTYTSGSSAEPKGVVHTQGVVMRGTHWFSSILGENGDTAKVFCAFPFFWIGGTLILGGAIQSGFTVLCIERFEPGAALDLVERERATMAAGWPTLLQAMRDHPSFPDRDLPAIPGLTVGPSDVALNDTPVPGIPGHRGMSETVGNFRGVEIRCVDPETGLDVAEGEEGELWVGGPGLMHGYYKKEREEVFDDDGWFHTGDRVFMYEGRPFFVGRFTEMVKSQGANVAPREVELFLETFDEVLFAFVVGMPHPERGEEVTAVLVPAKGYTIDVEDLQGRAREQISSYKVPTRIEVWSEDEVPWLGSGKPDKLVMKVRLDETTERGEVRDVSDRERAGYPARRERTEVMALSPEHVEFLREHKFSILSTGRRDGSPQASMVGHATDGNGVLVVFRRTTAKYRNVVRQPRVVLSIPDGRRVLTIYGDGELVEKDPDRVDAFQTILSAYGMPEQSRDELAKGMDDEDRVILRIHPSSVELHD